MFFDLLQFVFHADDEALDLGGVGFGAHGVDLAAHFLADETELAPFGCFLLVEFFEVVLAVLFEADLLFSDVDLFQVEQDLLLKAVLIDLILAEVLFQVLVHALPQAGDALLLAGVELPQEFEDIVHAQAHILFHGGAFGQAEFLEVVDCGVEGKHRGLLTDLSDDFHDVANALAAAACACAVGAPLQAVARGLAGMSSVDGRLSLHEGINESLVIDDSYNANPGSVKAAIDTLMSFSGERLLVLGDMAELGEQEVIFHEEVGRYAAEKGVSRLLATGELSINSVRECVIQGGDASHFDSKSELVEALLGALGPDTVVLVKGSRSAAMDEVVAMLTEPSNKTGEH